METQQHFAVLSDKVSAVCSHQDLVHIPRLFPLLHQTATLMPQVSPCVIYYSAALYISLFFPPQTVQLRFFLMFICSSS